MTNEMVPPEMSGADPRGPENVVLGVGVTGTPAGVVGAARVTTGVGVGVTSTVAVGTNAGGVSVAGVADGLTTGEHATSSPASAQPINIPVLDLARIGQFSGRLVGARVRTVTRLTPGAIETLRLVRLLR
jgi:hypothetical protein